MGTVKQLKEELHDLKLEEEKLQKEYDFASELICSPRERSGRQEASTEEKYEKVKSALFKIQRKIEDCESRLAQASKPE